VEGDPIFLNELTSTPVVDDVETKGSGAAMKRRAFLLSGSFSLATFALGAGRQSTSESTITVFKDPTCGCCNGWVEHLRENGFKAIVREVKDSELRELKKKYGVPSALQTCHTGIVDGYVIEGHVPAAEIRRALKEHPKALGLVVPGMPQGSPGMEGTRTEEYSVLLFDSAGQSSVYGQYPEK
jgi:hypothetical protein